MLPEDWSYYSFRSPCGYSESVCPLSLRNSEPTRLFSPLTSDEHPRRHELADGPLSSLYAPSPSLNSFGAASEMMCCSACPASSRASSVLPEDRIGSIRNLASKRFPDGYSTGGCACVPAYSEDPNLRGCFHNPRLTNTPDATALPMAHSHHLKHPHQV